MKSNVPGAGYGLFSTSDYPEKHLLTLMYGTLKTFAEASKESDATFHYTLVPRALVLEGIRKRIPGYGGASFANHGGKFANASPQRIPLLGSLVHLSGLVTTKAIIKGSELLVNYGPGYQRKHPYVRDPQDDPNAHGSVWDETTMHLAQVICASCFGVQLGYKLLGGDCPSLRTQEQSVHGGLAGRGPFTPTPPPPPPWKLAGKCRTMGAEGARSKICLNK